MCDGPGREVGIAPAFFAALGTAWKVAAAFNKSRTSSRISAPCVTSVCVNPLAAAAVTTTRCIWRSESDFTRGCVSPECQRAEDRQPRFHIGPPHLANPWPRLRQEQPFTRTHSQFAELDGHNVPGAECACSASFLTCVYLLLYRRFQGIERPSPALDPYKEAE